MKYTTLILAFFVGFFTPLTAQNTAKELLARSYNQTSLSQAITQSYISVIFKIDKNYHVQKLQSDALTFSDELDELDIELISIGLQDKLLGLKGAWLKYRNVLFSGGYQKDKIIELLEANVALVRECNTVSKVLKRYAEEQGGGKMITTTYNDVELLELLGKQSVYAHVIPTYYMLQTGKMMEQVAVQNYRTCLEEYENNLTNIIKLVDTQPDLTPLVTQNLAKWYTLEQICTTTKNEMEGLGSFYSLAKASAGLSQSNQLLINKIIEIGQQ